MRLAAAIVAILPPSAYYIYVEHLDKPLAEIEVAAQSWSVHPVHVPPNWMKAREDEDEIYFFGRGNKQFERMVYRTIDEERHIQDIHLRIDPAENYNVLFIHPHFQGPTLRYDYQRVIRPIAIHRVRIRNEGKSKLENAKVQFRLISSSSTRTYYGRWDGIENPEYRTILPTETHL